MHRQASGLNHRKQQQENTVGGLEKALLLLSCNEKFSLRSVKGPSGVYKSTVESIWGLLKAGDKASFSKLANETSKPDRCTVLTNNEERMIVERLI